MQGIQGRSRSELLQGLDNEANGRLALARRVKNFEKLNKKIFGTNCHLTTIGKIVNNKLFLLIIQKLLENFHEMFGLGPCDKPGGKSDSVISTGYGSDSETVPP